MFLICKAQMEAPGRGETQNNSWSGLCLPSSSERTQLGDPSTDLQVKQQSPGNRPPEKEQIKFQLNETQDACWDFEERIYWTR